MKPWIHYAAALAVFCHAAVYVGVGVRLPSPVKGWNGQSWLLGEAIGSDHLVRLSVTLHVIAGLVMLSSALAIALAPQAPGWWRPLAIAAGTLGIVAFLVFWDGQARLLLEEGALGALLSLALVVGALAWPQISAQ